MTQRNQTNAGHKHLKTMNSISEFFNVDVEMAFYKDVLPMDSKPKHIRRKDTKPVFQYTLAGEFIRRHESIQNAASSVRCNACNISSAANGRNKSAAGFKWSYEDKSISN